VHYETIRVLIWGKTYPELSAKYTETVCTGGIREDGRPIRLYPVPLRYLEGAKQYSLYDWIDVPVRKSTSDPRPESYKIRSDGVVIRESVGTDGATWRRRRELIFANPVWHFGSVEQLKAAQRETGASLGLVTPGVIEDVRIAKKPASAAREHEEKWRDIAGQVELFPQELKRLQFLPNDLKIRWRCADTCAECAERPHDMKALDWGLLELARKHSWDAALTKLEEISNLSAYDFRIFMGNFRQHLQVFGVIGMWYPKRREQMELL
jgi:hypothetical protein